MKLRPFCKPFFYFFLGPSFRFFFGLWNWGCIPCSIPGTVPSGAWHPWRRVHAPCACRKEVGLVGLWTYMCSGAWPAEMPGEVHWMLHLVLSGGV